MSDTVLTDARLVLPSAVMPGSVLLRDGRIAAIDPAPAAAGDSMDGDYLIPGVVDLHTDNLERQVQPRTNARWPSRSAMIAHDAQCAAAGVTTVLDALCVGDLGFDESRRRTFTDGVADIDAMRGTGLLKAEHFLHLRCELPAADLLELLEPVADHPLVRMISLMDHCPGYGQYGDIATYKAWRRKEGEPEDYTNRRIIELQAQRAALLETNRAALLRLVGGGEAPLASHDDRTPAEIARNAADGIRISEFPVAMEAALAAKAAGMDVIAGAPNIVRGGSHSGNVAAADLARAGAVDALASDYVPASLIEAAFLCVADGAMTLPAAIAMVTDRPAQMARLHDRGRIEIGLAADLVRVRLHEGMPVVRQVWRGGVRIA